MTLPDRAVVIDHADPSGFTVTLDPPGPGSTIDAVLATLPKAQEYAHGVALALRCPVIDCQSARKRDPRSASNKDPLMRMRDFPSL